MLKGLTTLWTLSKEMNHGNLDLGYHPLHNSAEQKVLMEDLLFR
jgi:hypothetical protein